MYTRYSSSVLRDDGVSIPLDPANRDYAAYIEWIALGNTPSDPIEVDPPTPFSVTLRQARLAIHAAGKYDDVQNIISGLAGEQGVTARIEWEFATTVERSSPVVSMLADQLGINADQLDDLFTLASTL